MLDERKSMSRKTESDSAVITAKKAGHILGVSPHAVTAYARRGQLRCIRDSNAHRLYRLADLERFTRERAKRIAHRVVVLQRGRKKFQAAQKQRAAK